MVEFDAFAGDIALGGLRNMSEIKILVCYMLSQLQEPISRSQLCDCLLETGLVNFFDLNEAIDDLLKQKMIQEEEYLDKTCLTATEVGKEHAKTLEKSLTFTLRERSVNAALKILARAKAERETDTDITKTETGYIVSLAIDVLGEKFFSLALFVGNVIQAEYLRERFLANSSEVYSGIVDCLMQQNDDSDKTISNSGFDENAVAVALKTLMKNEKTEANAEIEKTETGYNVKFAIVGLVENLLTLSLYAADNSQAEQLRENFLNNTSEVYFKIIDILAVSH